MKIHHYSTKLKWTGNKGNGTKNYRSYERDHLISAASKIDIQGSSDPSFRGDPTRYNPEELLVSSLSACHMLWFLHLCASNGIIIVEYSDNAEGIMEERSDGAGKFQQVILKPEVVVTEKSMITKSEGLHEEANKYCFIANSVNFEVKHLPVTRSMND